MTYEQGQRIIELLEDLRYYGLIVTICLDVIIGIMLARAIWGACKS